MLDQTQRQIHQIQSNSPSFQLYQRKYFIDSYSQIFQDIGGWGAGLDLGVGFCHHCLRLLSFSYSAMLIKWLCIALSFPLKYILGYIYFNKPHVLAFLGTRHILSLQGKKLYAVGTSLTVQWLRLHTSIAGALGSISSQGTKIPHATQHGQK